jgi:dCTP deaminase
MLSDGDIARAVLDHRLRLEPFDPAMIQPASVDVRLDRFFRVFANHRHTCIDPAVEMPGLTDLVDVAADEAFALHPGEFVLASTLEVVELGSDLAGRLEGKSSLGRLGLMVHSTAGFIDPGFRGTVTLELTNVAKLPIQLWPGMKIGQLCLFNLATPCVTAYGASSYGSRYQGQRGPTASRSFDNFRTWPDLLNRERA